MLLHPQTALLRSRPHLTSLKLLAAAVALYPRTMTMMTMTKLLKGTLFTETLQNGENSRQEPESPPPTGAPWTIDEKHQQASEASLYAAYSSAIEANYPDVSPSTSGATPSGLSLPPEPGTSGESTMTSQTLSRCSRHSKQKTF